MRFSVESWAPEYGVGADERTLDDADTAVDVGVEMSPDAWTPISPRARPAPAIAFVDGVRRIDARIWIDSGGRSWSAVCASIGAGVVVADERGARLDKYRVRRILVAPPDAMADSVTTRHGRYELVASVDDGAEAQYLAIHEAMTALELDLDVPTEPAGSASLTIYDGPLRGRDKAAAVGYIKTQRVQYLDEGVAPIVAALTPGQRTPAFGVGGPRGRPRTSV
ncbi:MAG: hypothetical protein ACK5OX_00160 [Desertimonas sp.]